MTNDEKLMQQALDLVDGYRDSTEDFRIANRCIALIEALRARLAQPEPESEHVATIGNWGKVMWKEGVYPQFNDKLYTAPPQHKEWQGLTDEEKQAIYRQADAENWDDQPLLETVEAKLKEKNNA